MTYAHEIQECLRDSRARAFAIESLHFTLPDIGFDRVFVDDIVLLLANIREQPSSGAFRREVNRFREKWQISLQRFYSWGYEKYRRTYFDNFILPHIPNSARRILDLGCGRGLFSEYISDCFPHAQVVGVDEAYFPHFWEDVERRRPLVKLAQIDTEDLADWFSEQTAFDCTLLMWVLHHSTPHDTELLLRALGQDSRAGSILIVEDSWMSGFCPSADSNGFAEHWDALANADKAFDSNTHAILDFVAVQILAGYRNVSMTRNYRRGPEWIRTIESCVNRHTSPIYIGFPSGRDIAVPQLLLKVAGNEATPRI